VRTCQKARAFRCWRHFDIVTSHQQFCTTATLTGLYKCTVYIIIKNSLILSSILIKFYFVCSQCKMLRFWRQIKSNSVFRGIQFLDALNIEHVLISTCLSCCCWRHFDIVTSHKQFCTEILHGSRILINFF